MNADILKFDMLNRYPGHTIEDSTDGSFFICKLMNDEDEVNCARALDESDVLAKLRQNIVGGSEIAFVITEAQKDTLSGVMNGYRIWNSTASQSEIFIDDTWEIG